MSAKSGSNRDHPWDEDHGVLTFSTGEDNRCWDQHVINCGFGLAMPSTASSHVTTASAMVTPDKQQEQEEDVTETTTREEDDDGDNDAGPSSWRHVVTLATVNSFNVSVSSNESTEEIEATMYDEDLIAQNEEDDTQGEKVDDEGHHHRHQAEYFDYPVPENHGGRFLLEMPPSAAEALIEIISDRGSETSSVAPLFADFDDEDLPTPPGPMEGDDQPPPSPVLSRPTSPSQPLSPCPAATKEILMDLSPFETVQHQAEPSMILEMTSTSQVLEEFALSTSQETIQSKLWNASNDNAFVLSADSDFVPVPQFAVVDDTASLVTEKMHNISDVATPRELNLSLASYMDDLAMEVDATGETSENAPVKKEGSLETYAQEEPLCGICDCIKSSLDEELDTVNDSYLHSLPLKDGEFSLKDGDEEEPHSNCSADLAEKPIGDGSRDRAASAEVPSNEGDTEPRQQNSGPSVEDDRVVNVADNSNIQETLPKQDAYKPLASSASTPMEARMGLSFDHARMPENDYYSPFKQSVSQFIDTANSDHAVRVEDQVAIDSRKSSHENDPCASTNKMILLTEGEPPIRDSVVSSKECDSIIKLDAEKAMGVSEQELEDNVSGSVHENSRKSDDASKVVPSAAGIADSTELETKTVGETKILAANSTTDIFSAFSRASTKHSPATLVDERNDHVKTEPGTKLDAINNLGSLDTDADNCVSHLDRNGEITTKIFDGGLTHNVLSEVDDDCNTCVAVKVSEIFDNGAQDVGDPNLLITTEALDSLQVNYMPKGPSGVKNNITEDETAVASESLENCAQDIDLVAILNTDDTVSSVEDDNQEESLRRTVFQETSSDFANSKSVPDMNKEFESAIDSVFGEEFKKSALEEMLSSRYQFGSYSSADERTVTNSDMDLAVGNFANESTDFKLALDDVITAEFLNNLVDEKMSDDGSIEGSKAVPSHSNNAATTEFSCKKNDDDMIFSAYALVTEDTSKSFTVVANTFTQYSEVKDATKDIAGQTLSRSPPVNTCLDEYPSNIPSKKSVNEKASVEVRLDFTKPVATESNKVSFVAESTKSNEVPTQPYKDSARQNQVVFSSADEMKQMDRLDNIDCYQTYPSLKDSGDVGEERPRGVDTNDVSNHSTILSTVDNLACFATAPESHEVLMDVQPTSSSKGILPSNDDPIANSLHEEKAALYPEFEDLLSSTPNLEQTKVKAHADLQHALHERRAKIAHRERFVAVLEQVEHFDGLLRNRHSTVVNPPVNHGRLVMIFALLLALLKVAHGLHNCLLC
jgi:hypothetical protein